MVRATAVPSTIIFRMVRCSSSLAMTATVNSDMVPRCCSIYCVCTSRTGMAYGPVLGLGLPAPPPPPGFGHLIGATTCALTSLPVIPSIKSSTKPMTATSCPLLPETITLAGSQLSHTGATTSDLLVVIVTPLTSYFPLLSHLSGCLPIRSSTPCLVGPFSAPVSTGYLLPHAISDVPEQ